ncbi:SulP family inorganic anion transporter [Telmatobacter sp. DSM 110680]|uniref:SulP family inorganic anion transporter n=1 Tax=Telmatobacter sp. DSM 110680 TaxID=3036704 RepID=A0AAU7DDS1_9BACT
MSISNPNLPKLVVSLRQYSRQMFVHDLLAGITVGLVALPLAMAFGIASGVTPQAGLYTAVVAGFLISALGGSRTQIGGPTGAFVVIVAGIVARFGLPGLAMVTLMAGIILLAMGLTGLGSAVRFIPRPVVIGFTNGIAVLIASTQIKDFFGLRVGAVPSEFLPRMKLLLAHMPSLNWQAFALGAATLAIMLILPRFTKRVPSSIVALLACTVACFLFHLPVETIGTRFGGIPRGLPPFAIPDFHAEHILPLIPSAFTVALLAALESMLSAVVADSMTGDRHNPNVELVAQGIANITSPLFGGIPATGAIARTATNIRSGARSPVSGMVHALTLLMILLVAAPLASFIPLATLAAVLFVVAYNMGEWREIPGILQLGFTAISVWLVTFALTVFADLTVAVSVGMALAALVYIYRIAETTTVTPVTDDYIRDGLSHSLQGRIIPPYVTLLRIHGPFLFGTTEKLLEATSNVEVFEPVVILRLRNMTAIDATGIHAIESFAKRLTESGRTLLLCGAMEQPSMLLQKPRFLDHVGRENIMPNIQAALDRAKEVYESRAAIAS